MFGRDWRLGALFAGYLLLGTAGPLHAQPRTMGSLFNAPDAYDGYTLFEAMSYQETFLIDNRGRRVHSWVGEHPVAAMSYLLENGHLLRVANPGDNPVFQGGGAGGLIREIDWDGTVLWEYVYSNKLHRQHHDIAPLPNGNVLLIAWEYRSITEAVEAGRDPAFLAGSLWPETIVEIDPTSTVEARIVWEWRAWDHLIQDFDDTKANHGVVADHPGLIDLNYPATAARDWLHFNAIDYDAGLDQIMVSSPRFGELWIIDHGTTTAEAAGHTGGARGKGGDLLYRWGNPHAYGRGTPDDKRLFFQHNTHWIDPGLPGAGHLLVFNNGNGRPDGAYSTVEEIISTADVHGDYPDPPPGQPHGPAEAAWTFTATPPGDLYSPFVSGAQRQPNGNTLICAGSTGTLREIDPDEETVWLYVNPVNSGGPQIQGEPPSGNVTFRAVRYPSWYRGLWYRNLEPGEPIELYPPLAPVAPVAVAPFVERPRFELAQNFPNPFRPSTTISFSVSAPAQVRLDVYDVAGRHVTTLLNGPVSAGNHRCTWDAFRLPSGVYHCTLRVGAESTTRTMTLVR